MFNIIIPKYLYIYIYQTQKFLRKGNLECLGSYIVQIPQKCNALKSFECYLKYRFEETNPTSNL